MQIVSLRSVKFHFLGKIRKLFQNVVYSKFYLRACKALKYISQVNPYNVLQKPTNRLSFICASRKLQKL